MVDLIRLITSSYSSLTIILNLIFLLLPLVQIFPNNTHYQKLQQGNSFSPVESRYSEYGIGNRTKSGLQKTFSKLKISKTLLFNLFNLLSNICYILFYICNYLSNRSVLGSQFDYKFPIIFFSVRLIWDALIIYQVCVIEYMEKSLIAILPIDERGILINETTLNDVNEILGRNEYGYYLQEEDDDDDEEDEEDEQITFNPSIAHRRDSNLKYSAPILATLLALSPAQTANAIPIPTTITATTTTSDKFFHLFDYTYIIIIGMSLLIFSRLILSYKIYKDFYHTNLKLILNIWLEFIMLAIIAFIFQVNSQQDQGKINISSFFMYQPIIDIKSFSIYYYFNSSFYISWIFINFIILMTIFWQKTNQYDLKNDSRSNFEGGSSSFPNIDARRRLFDIDTNSKMSHKKSYGSIINKLKTDINTKINKDNNNNNNNNVNNNNNNIQEPIMSPLRHGNYYQVVESELHKDDTYST